MEQLQSHTVYEEGLPKYKEMRKYFPINEEAVSHMALQLFHSEFPYTYMRKI